MTSQKVKVVWVLAPCQSPFLTNSVKPMTNLKSAGDGVSIIVLPTHYSYFLNIYGKKKLDI